MAEVDFSQPTSTPAPVSDWREPLKAFSQPTSTPAPVSDWREPLKADPELAPHVPNISEKDLPTFVKSHLNLQKKLGDSISLKDDPNAIKAKLYEKGLLAKPPEKYEISRPDTIPEHAWQGDLVEKFEGIAKKHGLSSEAVKDLLSLEAGRFENMKVGLKTDRESAEKTLREQWQKEGKDYESQVELGSRAAKHLFTQEEVDLFDKLGVGDHPKFLAALAKIGEGLQEDIGDIGTTAFSETDADVIEARAIMTPGHAKHDQWLKEGGKGPVSDFIDRAYKKLPGAGKQVTIS